MISLFIHGGLVGGEGVGGGAAPAFRPLLFVALANPPPRNLCGQTVESPLSPNPVASSRLQT